MDVTYLFLMAGCFKRPRSRSFDWLRAYSFSATCNVFSASPQIPPKMHSTLVRAQNVFGFFTTVAFCTAILTALSVLLTVQEPSAKIELRNVQV